MGNRVFLNSNNIIEVIYEGDLDLAVIKSIVADSQGVADELAAKGQPVDFLFDFTNMGKTDLAAEKYAIQAMKDMNYHKMAGFAASPTMRHLTNILARVAGKHDSNQHFDTRAEAETWLAQP